MNLRAIRWVWLLGIATGLAHAQVLYVGDSGDGTIKRVDSLGNVTTYATGFANVYGVVTDAGGNIYVSSTTAHKIVKIAPSLTVTDYATDFPANSNLMGMTFDGAGNLYVADVSAGVYRVLPDGSTSLWATGMSYPRDVAFNGAGSLFAVGGYNPMAMYSIAGDGTPALFASEPATAGFNSIDFDSFGNARVGASNLTLYQITPSGVVSNYQGFLPGMDITDVVYAGNGTFYFLTGGSLYRDVSGNMNTFATGFSNPTSLAFAVAVPEPSVIAAVFGAIALGLAVRRRRHR